jgi:dethiobiotin synthetase
MKPIASGCNMTPEGLRNDDAEALMQAANVHAAYADINPYAFLPPISPHIAAREAGVEIDLSVISRHFSRLSSQADCVVVEGAGGWLSPIADGLTMADVAIALKLPVVLVVSMRLGCLSQALLAQTAIVESGLPFAGWVANCVEPEMDRLSDNVDSLRHRLRAPLWAMLPHASDNFPASITDQLREAIPISE